ncbi:hypothetical protein [Acetobacter lovaniensis]|uniref:Tail fiber protein n=1 Tax=Acetobacter lovaniensis TaxID=104100 RepID=A0A841QHH2_9PROT|nr:hypothetical protein [Acetobacter lovaniensis]MBB6458011.1 hypothetical protein [Acetobacter lovaniensis]NHN82266.1 hypothetical protein [Acetobacter lovaniensis]GBQ72937.1 hypothetical protein AA0474_2822 [Acetobacter lovaniensis NRIC 0474]
MPYDGNGNYTLPSVYKATPGTEIMTTQHNTPLEDVQAALNAVLLRNGSAPITGNWNMGTNRITFLADGVANADAANVGQLKALLNNTALTGVTTVPAVTDWTAYQPVGAKDADARYAILNGSNVFMGAQKVSGPVQFAETVTITGDQPAIHFTRPGVPQWDIWVGDDGILYIRSFDASGKWLTDYVRFKPGAGIEFVKEVTLSGGATVTDITDFVSKGVLNAVTAEGRYIKSIPVSPNKRVTDIWENADGRTVTGDGTGSNVLASLTDLPLDDPELKLQIFRVQITFQNNAIVTIPFPKAFKPGTTPKVVIPSTQEIGGGSWYSTVGICEGNGNQGLSITNTQFQVFKIGWGGGVQFAGNTGTVVLDVFAAGYYS